jgi:DNA polymerase III gamma/tau subunit
MADIPLITPINCLLWRALFASALQEKSSFKETILSKETQPKHYPKIVKDLALIKQVLSCLSMHSQSMLMSTTQKLAQAAKRQTSVEKQVPPTLEAPQQPLPLHETVDSSYETSLARLIEAYQEHKVRHNEFLRLSRPRIAQLQQNINKTEKLHERFTILFVQVERTKQATESLRATHLRSIKSRKKDGQEELRKMQAKVREIEDEEAEYEALMH